MLQLTVTELAPTQWQRTISTTVLPFGRQAWLAVGLAERPELRLVRCAIWTGLGAPLLVPLCLQPDGTGQVGCIGYGGIYPSQPVDPLPDFGSVAAVLCTRYRLRELRTLLPPATFVPLLDQFCGELACVISRPTYLLDIGSGLEEVWRGTRGSVRTAIRRAGVLGITAVPLTAADTGPVRELYDATLARNMARRYLGTAQVEALLGELAVGTATGSMALSATGKPLAITLFAVAGDRAYHVIQAGSEEGLASNAGYLSLWSTFGTLVRRGIQLLDLGSAHNVGQQRFKLAWGSIQATPRLIRWKPLDTAGIAG